MKFPYVRSFAVLITVMITVLSLFSCGEDEPPAGGTSGGVIFSRDAEPTLVFGDGISTEMRNTVYSGYKSAFGVTPYFASPSSPAVEHEIIFGVTDRPASRKAYRKLRALRSDDGYTVSYVIYATGTSVAVAFDEDAVGLNERIAIEYFLNNYLFGKSELRLTPGVVYSATYSTLEYAERTDAEYKEKAWAALSAAIGEGGDVAVAAMKELYSLYDPEMVLWLANLYEPHNCYCGECEVGSLACGGGGFYYSNSARDTEGYLPDIESTYQAMVAIDALGLTYNVGENYADSVPKWMKQQLVVFARSLQEEDGYFYHPQWRHIYSTGDYGARLGRDIDWAVNLLGSFGYSPRFRTPTGVSGDGGNVIPNGLLTGVPYNDHISDAPITASLTASGAQLTSRVVSCAVVEWLRDLDALKAYLEELSTRYGNFYSLGSTVSAQMSQIKERDRELGTEGTDRSMVSYVINWFNSKQNPDNGLWENTTGYTGVNGLLKISVLYNTAGAPIPNAERAAYSAIEVITSPIAIGAGVDIYNTWGSLSAIMKNLRSYGGASGSATADRIRAAVIGELPTLLAATREKIEPFEKKDHSFSYNTNTSSTTSQGMPAALPGTVEGDINGNVLVSSDLVSLIYNALELREYKVPIFGYREWVMFITEISSLGPVQKIEEEEIESFPITFDDDELGAATLLSPVLGSAGARADIVVDPRGEGRGNVLYFESNKGAGDSVKILNEGSTGGSMQVFETEIMVAKDGTDSGYIAQIFIGDDSMLAIKVDGGRVCIHEVTTGENATAVDTLLARVDFDKWFKLRVEHYTGTSVTTRTKLYLDDKLIAVTDNYQGKDKNGGSSEPKNTRLGHTYIYVTISHEIVMYLDNCHTYTSNQKYSIPTEGLDDLVVNVDAPKPEPIVTDIRLDAAGGKTDKNTVTVTQGEAYALPVAERDGYVFLGWYSVDGTSVPLTGDAWSYGIGVTLTARWREGRGIGNYNDFDNGEAGLAGASVDTATYTEDGGIILAPKGFNNNIYFCVGERDTLYMSNMDGTRYVFEADLTYLGGGDKGQGLAFVGFLSETVVGKGNGAMHKCSYMKAGSEVGEDGYATTVELYDAVYEIGVTYRVRYEYIVGQNVVEVYTNGTHVGTHSFKYTQPTVDPTSVYAFQLYFRAQGAGTLLKLDNVFCGITPPELEEIDTTVIFDLAGGTLDSETATIRYGAAYELPIPERDGYHFVGWYDISGAAVPAVGAHWLYDTTTILSARWREDAGGNFNNFEGTLEDITGASVDTGMLKDGALILSPQGYNGKIFFALGDMDKLYSGNTAGTRYVFEADFTYLGGARTGEGLAFAGFLNTLNYNDGNGAMHKCSYLRGGSLAGAGGYATNVELYGAVYEIGVTYRVRYEYAVGEGVIYVYTNGTLAAVHKPAYTQDAIDPASVYAFQLYFRAQGAGTILKLDNVYAGIEMI